MIRKALTQALIYVNLNKINDKRVFLKFEISTRAGLKLQVLGFYCGNRQVLNH